MGEERFGRAGAVAIGVLFLLSTYVPAAGAARRISAKNVAAARGITATPTMTYGSAWVDYDSDRDIDLLVNRHWRAAWFFAARGASYVRSSEDFVGLPGSSESSMVDRHHCMWGEADGRRPADLYCAVGAQMGRGRGPNQLIVRKRSGWVDRAGRLGLTDPYGRGRSVNWVDYDGDRDLDLFVANALRRGVSNKLYRNDRGSFRRMRNGLNAEYESLTSSWADWDADGDADLLVTRGGITGCCPRAPVAYENRDGRFARTRLRGITDTRVTSAAWADHDDDGRIDVALVSRRRIRILRNQGGRFRVASTRSLALGRAAVWLDWDNDADLDLFVVQGATGSSGSATNRPDLLLVQNTAGFTAVKKHPLRGPERGNGETATSSDFDRDGKIDLLVTNGNNPSSWEGSTELLRNTSAVGNWAALDLDGGRWNPFGIGAEIQVTTTHRSYWRFVTDGAGYKAQSDPGYVHLGLGPSSEAVVVIRWAGGGRDCVTIAAGRIRRIRRGETPCA